MGILKKSKIEKEFINHIKNMRAIRSRYVEMTQAKDAAKDSVFIGLIAAEMMRLENSLGSITGWGDLPPDESRNRIFKIEDYMAERIQKIEMGFPTQEPPASLTDGRHDGQYL